MIGDRCSLFLPSKPEWIPPDNTVSESSEVDPTNTRTNDLLKSKEKTTELGLPLSSSEIEDPKTLLPFRKSPKTLISCNLRSQ